MWDGVEPLSAAAEDPSEEEGAVNVRAIAR